MKNNKKLSCLGILKKYSFKVIAAPILKGVEVICELLVPFLVRAVIDNGLTDGGSNFHDSSYIISICLIVLALAFAGFFATMVTQYISSKTSTSYSYDLKREIYSHLNTLSISQVEEFGKSKALNLLTSDAISVQNGVFMLMRLLVRAPFLVVGSIVCSFLISPLAGLIVLISLLLCAGVIFLVIYLTPKQYSELQKHLDCLNGFGDDNIVGGRVIRAFNKEEEEIDSFKKETNKYRKQAILISKINAFINPLTFAFVNLAIVLIIYIGAKDGLSSSLSIGGIVAIMSFLTQSLAALIMFTRLVTSLSKAFASKKRVDDFFALESNIVPSTKAIEEIQEGESLLTLKDVCVSFGGETNALDNINLTIKKGETIGLIGGTGSGKSTLISLLNRFRDPSKGAVYFGHDNEKDLNLEQLRSQFAIVFQKPEFFKGTIESNLKLGNPNASKEEIEEALSLSLSMEFVSRYKDYYQHEVEENGTNFSGGQKQRLLIARALLSHRPILVLDDSTSALDYKSDAQVRKNISSIKGLTTIIVSQRATSIRNCDCIYVLDKGKIIGQGKHDDLLSSCLVYKEIYEAQVKKNEKSK
ncbi:MAG TPA: hypothetical protein DEF61_03120 [Firmicutes bacterium]|nr:hypothetical protein [Bacillota bacterium]